MKLGGIAELLPVSWRKHRLTGTNPLQPEGCCNGQSDFWNTEPCRMRPDQTTAVASHLKVRDKRLNYVGLVALPEQPIANSNAHRLATSKFSVARGTLKHGGIPCDFWNT